MSFGGNSEVVWLGVLGEANLIRRYHARQLDPTQLDPTLLSLVKNDSTNVVTDAETSRYQNRESDINSTHNRGSESSPESATEKQ